MNFSSSGGALNSSNDADTDEPTEEELSPSPPPATTPSATAASGPPVRQGDSTTTSPSPAPSPSPSGPVDVSDHVRANTVATGPDEHAQARMFTALDDEDSGAVGGPQLFTVTNTQRTSTLSTARAPSPAAAQPVQARLAVPAAVVNIVAGLVAAVFAPFVTPAPAIPARPPLLLFAVLDWIRREIQRTFFNRTPHAVSDAITTSEGITGSGNVLDNETDADADPLTATLLTGPAHGDLVLNPNGSFTYTPDAGFAGADSFTYTVSDETGRFHVHGLSGFLTNGGHTETATVAITVTDVNDAPIAVNDIATAVGTTATGNVLTNDSDADADTLTAELITGPTHGALTFGSDGSFTYTAEGGFTGVDAFTYRANDATAYSNTATVTVTVGPTMGTPNPVTGVVTGDLNAADDSLTYTVTSAPEFGRVSIADDGTFTYTPTQAGLLRAGIAGADVDSFSVGVSDGTHAPITIAVADIPVAAAELRVEATPISVGYAPVGVAVSADGIRAYVANSGPANLGPGATVSVIDTATDTVIATIPVGSRPTGVAVSPDGTRVYVTNQASSTVSVIDTATNTVVATVSLPPGSSPTGVTVSPDGTRVYVANSVLVGNVSVIDTSTNTVTATIPIAVQEPTGVVVTPDGTRLYVSGKGSGTVQVFDTATNNLVDAAISVSGANFGLAISPDGGRIYTTDYVNDAVLMFDTGVNFQVGAVPVGSFPSAVVVSPDGSLVYVTNSLDNTVSVIDTATKTVIGSPIVVGDYPQALAVSPDGTRIYVTSTDGDTVSVISFGR